MVFDQNSQQLFALRFFFQNPTGVVNESIDGYSVTIERLPSNKRGNWTFTRISRECTVILSGASFKVQVLAYNAAGTSPTSEITIPPFTQMSLRKQLNASILGNNTIFVNWKTNKSKKTKLRRFILDWYQVTGNKTLIIQSEKLKKPMSNYTIKGPFKPNQRYRIMLHRRENKRNQVNDSETTEGMVDIYVLEGTISVNSSTASLVLTGLTRKTVYAVHALGFTNAGDGVRSPVVSFATEEFGDGEITKIAVGVSFAVIGGVFLLVWIFSVIVKRVKEDIWPNIPNPKNSYAIEIMRKGPSVPNLNDDSLNLSTNAPAEEAEEELEIIHPIEGVLSSPTHQELQKNEQDNLLRDPDQESRNSLKSKPTAVVQVTDYTTMEHFHQMMPNFANNGPGGTFVRPDQSKAECNYQSQQSDFPVPDYVKQPVHQAFKQMNTKTSRNQTEWVIQLKDSETLNLLNSLNLKQKPSGEQCEHLYSEDSIHL
eukprot:gi/632949909/ref/XP_007890419.1/ PREDICTED: uncharacterized protein LOC103177862 [Callorhinchus milii]